MALEAVRGTCRGREPAEAERDWCSFTRAKLLFFPSGPASSGLPTEDVNRPARMREAECRAGEGSTRVEGVRTTFPSFPGRLMVRGDVNGSMGGGLRIQSGEVRT